MTDATLVRPSLPGWLALVALLGAGWNAFGIFQLADFVTKTQASLLMSGMSSEAARLYYGLPSWMTIVFAVGSTGGLIGSFALLARRSAAVPVFATSLLGYIALFAGDYAYGVFDAIPGQMAILAFVVLVAASLLIAAWVARSRGLLRPHAQSTING